MQNDHLSISISAKGAELTSIKDQRTGYEFLWQADPAIWGRHAPVLFPIVGKVANNQLLIDGKTYPMNQHGFARDQQFVLISETETEVWYELKSNPQLLTLFPYEFVLQLGYTLEGNTLLCHYKISTPAATPLFFSIGAHPGFNLPTQKLSDYLIEFEQNEQEERHLLTGGLFDGRQKPVLTSPQQIQLSKALFDEDAIVFKQLNSSSLTLKQKTGTFSIALQYKDFGALGIWTQKNCEQYICLEPWCGYADNTKGQDDISTKEGIVELPAGALFERTYSLTFAV